MYYLLFLMPLMTACQYLPQLAKDIEEVETDTAIRLEVSREMFQKKETDFQINITVQNKDEFKK